MSKKQKGWISLSVKLNALILVIILAVSGGLAGIAYHLNSDRVDRYYQQITSNYAATVAAFMDGDEIERFLDVICEDDYRTLRETADQTHDESMIEDRLRKTGLYTFYQDTCETLTVYRDRLGVEYVYIQAVDKNLAVNIIDPDEDLIYIGSIEISAEEFGSYQSNQRIEPTISRTDFGWLCSAYEPVYTSDGTAIALVGVDISMNDVMAERHQFLLYMILFAFIVLVVSVTVSMLLMRRIATKPLSQLAKATFGFADSDKGYTMDDVILLPIHSKDEIGDLYKEIRFMQMRIVEYLNNLTQVTAEKERIGAELDLAAGIQADMLPSIFPAFPDREEFDIFASMTPAKEVGGDFYDFFMVDDDHLALVMADVSGKGVPAALFMVIAKTLIKTQAQMGHTPAEILYNVNNQLCEGNEAELFVTVWLAIIEISTGKGIAANAGHEYPVLRRSGKLYELIKYRHSPAVATMEDMRFREHTFELFPGDTLFVYTDGVPEATDAHNTMYGTDRMLQVMNAHLDSKPEELLHVVKQSVDEFVGDAPQFDDVTMLCLKYLGPVASELTLDAHTDNMEEVMAFVDSRLQSMDCDPKIQKKIEIALEELYVNVAHYAYAPQVGTVTIRFEEEGTEDAPVAVITLIDNGVPYNPLEKEDPDVTLSAEERNIGGLGIYMVKKSMDDVLYEYKDGKNHLTIKKMVRKA